MILHTIPGIYEEASGPSYTVPRLCEALVSLGLDSRIATLDYGPLPRPMPYAQTFKIGRGIQKLGRSPAMWQYMQQACTRGEITLLHNHSLWMMPNVYPGWAAKKYSIPLVVSPRGVFTEYALSIGSRLKPVFWRFVQGPSLEHVRLFHATAESEYHDIRRMGYRQPVAIIPNGIDIPSTVANFTAPVRTLLFLGRLHPNKGLELLLRAWSQVEGTLPEWQLQIVGSGSSDYQLALRSLAEALGIRRVHFAGALYGERKFDAYRAADCYVLPSFSENFGVTIAEALASGLPAIVTKGAPWEGLDRMGAGRWIDTNEAALSDAIVDVCSQDRDQLRRMGTAGRQWMMEEFAWNRIAVKTASVYDWIAGRSDMPSCVCTD